MDKREEGGSMAFCRLFFVSVPKIFVREPRERPQLGLSQLNCGTDRQRTPLQDGDHSGWFQVFHVCVPGSSQNGSGECPYLWVKEKFI